MRIAICDDSQKEQEQFVNALHGWDPTREPECFATGTDFLEVAKKPPVFDIVFLDIYMPGENGVDIAKKLQKISPKTEIVFVTTSREHAVDAFSLHAMHYLVKPVTTKGIVEAFCRLTQLRTPKRPIITLTVGHDSYMVYLDEICYLQSVNHAVEIFLTNGRKIKVWTALNELETKLNESFLRLNRGTIVNMEQIEQMGNDTCMLQDGTRLEFSRRKRAEVQATYDNYLFTRLSQRKGFGGEVVL